MHFATAARAFWAPPSPLPAVSSASAQNLRKVIIVTQNEPKAIEPR